MPISDVPDVNAIPDSPDVDPESLFRQAMAQTRMAVCLTDPYRGDNPMVFVNPAFCTLTGYPSEELVGRNCRLLQGPDTDGKTVAVLREAIAEEEVVVVDLLNYRKDGSAFWNALHIGPIHDANGELQFFFGSQWNVSEMHAARAGEHLAHVLTHELSHRMRNMFAVISGIVSISARHAGVPWVATKINERIAALGRAHDDSLNTGSSEHLELGRVARLTLAPYLETHPGQIAIRGERVLLRPSTVSLIGLALHELAINALKHGALADRTHGRVELDWAFDRPRALVVQWREHSGGRGGSRSTVSGDAPPGIGAGIVSELVRAAGGRLETRWIEKGLRLRIELPLDTVRAERSTA